MAKIQHSWLTVGIAMLGFFIAPANVQAQDFGFEDPKLPRQQLSKVEKLKAEGPEAMWARMLTDSRGSYRVLREPLIDFGPAALTMLRKEATAPQYRQRWLARAILGRVEAPASYRKMDQEFRALVKKYSEQTGFIVPRLDLVALFKQTAPFPGFDSPEALPYLAEQLYAPAGELVDREMAAMCLLRLRATGLGLMKDLARDQSDENLQCAFLMHLEQLWSGQIKPHTFEPSITIGEPLHDPSIIDTWFEVLNSKSSFPSHIEAVIGLRSTQDVTLLPRLETVLQKTTEPQLREILQTTVDFFKLGGGNTLR